MRSLILIAALMLGASGALARPATTFQLPPDPEATSTSRPQAQGPVDTEGETRTAPRVIGAPTPQPTPRASTPSPRPSVSASPSPNRSPTPQSTSRPTARPTTGTPLPTGAAPVSTREVLPEQPAQSAADDSATAQDTGEDATTDAPTTMPGEPQTGPLALPDVSGTGNTGSAGDAAQVFGYSIPWVWLAGVLAALLALGALLVALTRRRSSPGQDAVEELEPSGPPARLGQQDGLPAAVGEGSVAIEASAITLSRSVMNATISYRVTLVNQGRVPVSDIRLHGDVTTAHGQIPADQQLADTQQPFPELHALPRLDPGQRSTVHGELRMPLREVRALRQGSVPVFVPLLRLTVRGDNLAPRAYTYVIGTKAVEKGARPNPFRLDEPPRSYDKLSTRAIA